MVWTLMLKPAALAISRTATPSCVRTPGRSEAISVAAAPAGVTAPRAASWHRECPAAFSGVGVETVGRVERRVVARRAVALGHEIDHHRAIDRERQRLPHTHVVERLLVAAHVDVAELAGRHAQRLHAACLLRRHTRSAAPTASGRCRRRSAPSLRPSDRDRPRPRPGSGRDAPCRSMRRCASPRPAARARRKRA